MTTAKQIKEEIESTRAILQTYLASDLDIDDMDYNEVVNYAIADVNDQNIFLGHWKDYAFLRGKLEGFQAGENSKHKSDLQQELEFLEIIKNQLEVHQNEYHKEIVDRLKMPMISIFDIDERINFIKKELEKN